MASNRQEARAKKQEISIPDGSISGIVSTDQTNVFKYHIQIPALWFAYKYAMWPDFTLEKKNAIKSKHMQQAAGFINNHRATVIMSGLPLEFEGWKIELIAAPESAYRQIVESLGLMLREQQEIIIYKNNDLGAEILALTKENRKEALDG